MSQLPPFTVALIIPTGIGARIGGFGGDAMTLLPMLASVCDTVITHPNVANAACFQNLPANVLYVEGYGLDRFFEGTWTLKPVRQNRVGLIWDSGISEEMTLLHQNTLAAVQTVYGVDIVGIQSTTAPLRLSHHLTSSGRSAGQIDNPQVLITAGKRLLAQGAEALAICCHMPADTDDADTPYQDGVGVDPIAGLEAMISHGVVATLQRPAAHAPVFPMEDALPLTDRRVDPRTAAEFIVPTFLPCVLTGLAKAPQFGPTDDLHGIGIDSLSALVVPGDALGGLPVLACVERGIPVLAVQNNTTVMACPPAALGLENDVTPCATYLEALGHLVALKAGITVPAHLTESQTQIKRVIKKFQAAHRCEAAKALSVLLRSTRKSKNEWGCRAPQQQSR